MWVGPSVPVRPQSTLAFETLQMTAGYAVRPHALLPLPSCPTHPCYIYSSNHSLVTQQACDLNTVYVVCGVSMIALSYGLVAWADACTFPRMITEWRRLFKNPTAYFGFVQLACWCGGGASGSEEASMRAYGQTTAALLPKVGWAANQDHCDGCNIHPPAKQFCADRLATSAMALQYNKSILWRSPTFKSQVAAESPPSMTITVDDVSPAGLTTDHFPVSMRESPLC